MDVAVEPSRSTKPTPNLEQEVFLNVLKAADLLTGELTELLKPHGLSPTQYNVLRILVPLTASDAILDEGLDYLEDALDVGAA